MGVKSARFDTCIVLHSCYIKKLEVDNIKTLSLALALTLVCLNPKVPNPDLINPNLPNPN